MRLSDGSLDELYYDLCNPDASTLDLTEGGRRTPRQHPTIAWKDKVIKKTLERTCLYSLQVVCFSGEFGVVSCRVVLDA